MALGAVSNRSVSCCAALPYIPAVDSRGSVPYAARGGVAAPPGVVLVLRPVVASSILSGVFSLKHTGCGTWREAVDTHACDGQ